MFSVLEPRVEDIDIDDIAHALAHQCRFSGHVRRHYSVAEHSVHVSRVVEELLRSTAMTTDPLLDSTVTVIQSSLLHDAAETYVVDLPRPIKRLPQMAPYREIEATVEKAIARRFGLWWPWHAFIKRADESMLGLEARELMPTYAAPEWWQPFLSMPTPMVMHGVTLGLKPREAKQMFLNRAAELGIR